MRLSLTAIAAAVALSSTAARADIMGNTLQITQAGYQDLGEIVVPGTSHSEGGATLFTVTDNQVDFTFNPSDYGNGSLFQTFTFQDLDGATGISSITTDPSSSDPSGIRFTPYFTTDSFTFDEEGTPGPGDNILFDLNYSTSVTPEPSSFALLGTGLLGVAGVVRKHFA